MAAGEHPAWVQVIGGEQIRLLDPGRMSRLVGELKDPVEQRPSFALFVGRQVKECALQELFPSDFQTGFCDGIASLRMDGDSKIDNPMFLAESNPDRAIPLETEEPSICEAESYPVAWAEKTTGQHVYDVLHARLFCLFVDVVFVFADDFTGFDEVIQMLESWAAAGSASIRFNSVRPRVVVVRRGDDVSPSPTYDLLKMEDLQHGLHRKSLKKFFSSIKILHLAAEQLFPLLPFRRLKELLRREIDEMRLIRHSLGCLYSALHVSTFFSMAVAHTAMSLTQPFDFVLASRRGNEVQPDFAQHVSRFLRLGERHHASRDALMIFIASSILSDAYPPKMHAFDPEIVYVVLYQQFCLQSLGETYSDRGFIQQQNSLIQNRLSILFSDMVTSRTSAIEIHHDTIRSLDIDWKRMKSNKTCLYCLRRTPENTLSCGHAVCDVCIRKWGHKTSTFDGQYRIKTCLLCCTGKLMVGLRPVTAGIRILSIDGGGTRGVIAIGIMNLLQSILGTAWRIQDLFDIAYGTSVGGLVVLMLFVRQLAVSKCGEIFHTLAKQLFPQPDGRGNHFSRFRHLIRSWYRDGRHDANKLESYLQENLGSDTRLFGHVPSLLATKVGVTAATIDKAFPVLMTNYNGLGKNDENRGYKVIRPEEAGMEPYIWQAGRATSAALVLFPSAYTMATGPVQDGGMSGHNNPIKLALWESLRIEPSLSKPSVVVSIGTGTRKRSVISPRFSTFRHVLFDGCIPRLWRAYMSSFDGESNFRDVVNNLDEESCENYKRLNVFLPVNEPAIDDTSRMSEMQESVHSDLQLMDDCRKTIYALLIASFYFELDSLPENLPGVRVQCSGMIRCQIPGEVMVELLKRVVSSRLAFVIDTRIIGYYDGKRDLCPLCRQYRIRVKFSVRHLDQSMSIQIQTPKAPQRKIGSFPQNMQWFINRQGLDAPFGTADHRDLRGSCKVCLSTGSYPRLKRQASGCEENVSPRKKARPL